MTHHVHLDMGEIEAALAKSRAALLPVAQGNGSKATQARMSIAVDQAFARQFAEEVNLGTDIDMVSDALAAVCTNMMRSLVDSCLPDGAPIELVRFHMMEQLNKQVYFMNANLAGHCEGPSCEVKAQKGRRA